MNSSITFYYKKLQLVSIDVVMGACLMCYLSAFVLDIDVHWSVYFVLATSVWLVYTLDHLLDAKSIKGQANTTRHLFHQEYFNVLIYTWLVFFIMTGIVTLVFLPTITIRYGILALIIVVFHLMLVKLLGTKVAPYIQKELGVGMAYVVGITVGPFSLSEQIPTYFYVFGLEVFVLAMINLFQFSYFDHEVDQYQNQTSISRNLGRSMTRYLIYTLFLIVGILCCVGFIFFPSYAIVQFILTCNALTLALITLKEDYFHQNERYRMLGDFVFIYPVILFLI